MTDPSYRMIARLLAEARAHLDAVETRQLVMLMEAV